MHASTPIFGLSVSLAYHYELEEAAQGGEGEGGYIVASPVMMSLKKPRSTDTRVASASDAKPASLKILAA